MTVKVDPFVIPIPDKWGKDPELAPTVNYLWRYLYDLRERTGGGNDAISSLEDSALYDVGIKGAEIAEIIKQIEELKVNFTIIETALANLSVMSSILQDMANQMTIEALEAQSAVSEISHQDNSPLILAELHDLRKRIEAIERGYEP